MIEVRVWLAVERDVLKGVGHDREVTQTQEVHLQQAERLARRVVKLGDDRAVLRALHDRDDVRERVGAHDDRARVHAPLTRQPLQAERVLDDLVRVGVLLVELAELRGLGVALVLLIEDAVDRDVFAHDRRGQGFGELLADLEVLAENARRVLQGLLGFNRAVGDDLADAVLTVLALDVGDDLVAPTFVEVDVEVRHGDSLGVEESLEDQTVIKGVQFGDLHGVGDHRSGTRTTTGPHADALRLCPVDVVGDGQEVAGETHRNDDVFLVLGLLAHGVRDAVREAITQASFDLLDEPRGLVFALGHREVGHVVRALLRGRKVHVAALGDLEGRVAGAGQLTPQRTHLIRGTDVVAITVELESVWVVNARTGVDAQERVLDLAVVALDVVRVVGGHEGRVHKLGDLEDLLVGPSLDVDAVVHDLDIEVFRPENVAQLRSLSHGLVPLPQAQARLHGTRRAAREHDEALVELGEQFLVGARPLAELAVRRGVGPQAEEIMHARRVVGDESQVIVGTAGAHVVGALPRLTPQDLLTIKARGSRRHVGLKADDRLHASVLAIRVEVVGTEQVSVIGQANRGLPEACRFLRHCFRLRRSIQHRILGVVVKVHEGISHASILLAVARAGPCNARARAVVHLTAHSSTRPWLGCTVTSVLGARVTQLVEGQLQVSRIGAGHAHRHARSRVSEAETNGVQPLAGESQALRLSGVCAIERIAHAGVTDGGHMHADLVGTSRLQVYLRELCPRHEFQGVVVGDSSLAAVNDGHTPFTGRVATDRSVDRARGRVEVTGDDRVVYLLDGALLEGPLHDRVGQL